MKGPELARFIRHHVSDPAREGGDALTRRLYDWERGARASIWTADRWLTVLGFHVADLPEHAWLDAGTTVPLRERTLR